MVRHLLAAALLAGCAQPASARVTAISVDVVERPAFAGRVFGAVGQYEKLSGTITGEVLASDPRNAGIVDLALAPRTMRGTVAYRTSFTVLRPVDPAAGRHQLLYEANNRGNKLMLAALDGFGSADAPAHPNDPATAQDGGDGWLMRQGFTLAWSGWDGLVVPGDGRMLLTVPVATTPDGAPVTGRSLDEWAIAEPGLRTRTLTYPAADPQDTAGATLTVREHFDDAPVPVAGWRYVSGGTAVALAGDAAFTQGRLYEFSYTATRALVEGLGFAAVRDVVAFLRYGAPGLVNPAGGEIAQSFGFGISQPGRMLRDFVHLGFNQAESGETVFDGVLSDIAGGNGIFLNARFAQPARTERQHTDRWYPEAQFPFAWQTTTDPVSGASDGRLQRCTATATCPKIIEALSENEYWSKAASLLTTDPAGQSDLPDPEGVRFYLFASLPHAAAEGAGICAQPQNPLLANTGLRALLAVLEDWVTRGTPPPDSRVPRLSDGTLAPPMPQSGVGFPAIPGVLYNGRATVRQARDYGPRAASGIFDLWPPVYGPMIYPSFVPVDDADGNDVAGIRLPDVAAPVATFTGWATQGPGQAEGDGCGPSGQMLPFPPRASSTDPRRPLDDRYPTHADYVAAVTQSAQSLAADRLLLPEDVANYVAAAEHGAVGLRAGPAPLPLSR